MRKKQRRQCDAYEDRTIRLKQGQVADLGAATTRFGGTQWLLCVFHASGSIVGEW